MITIKDIVIGFDNDLFAIDKVDFQRGKVHVLTGRNGIGKSAFLRTLSGLLKPLQGEISLDDKALHKYSDRELSTHISFVPSSQKGVSFLSVDAYLMLGRSNFTNMFGNASEEDLKAVEKAKSIFGINHLSHKYTNQLSSGELQLCAIAKAYVQETDYILLDEPTAHLDYQNKKRVYELLLQISNEQNKGIIISTHDLDLAFKFPFEFFLIKESDLKLHKIDGFNDIEKEFNT
jgi:iron complex transport system ATP-binding protein